MNLMRIIILVWACLAFDLSGMAQDNRGPLCLTLGDALRKAESINLQVMMANARLQQAIARISQSRSNLLPQIDGVVSGSRQTSDLRAEGLQIPIPGFGTHVGPYNTFDARPRVTVALFDPSAFERFLAAKKGKDLSEAQLDKTREDVLALVADLYIDAQRKQQSVNLLQTILDRDQMAFDLSQDNYAQGTGTLLNSNKLRSDLDQTKYLFYQAKLQAEDASLDLEASLQISLDTQLLFIDDKIFLKALENNTVTNFNNSANADIALASSALEARKADQKTAYADLLPKISGTADYGRSGASPGNGSNTYFVGVKATVPIWEGGAQQANIKEANGELKEAQENLLDANQQAQVNATKARLAIEETNDLREAKLQARQTAQKSLSIAFHSQEIGSGSVFEVMLAKAGLALAEDEYNEAQAAWVMAHIDLLHAQGRLRELVKKGE